jgi:uncharacterized protein YjbI with pentapeptide repeats
MGDTTTEPHNVHVRLNVGCVHFRTSLKTVMEGARLGCVDFEKICVNILQEDSSTGPAWDRERVPTEMEKYHVEHFIDADPTHFPFWLGYFRTRKVPYVEAGPLRQSLIVDSEEAGLKDLAHALRRLVDWRREDLQRLLVHRGAVLHGARLQGQDLSRLGFFECSLAYADLSGCNLSYCSFRDADLSGADLRKANLSNATLKDAILPAWNSGLLEGVRLTGATGWMPANKDLSSAKLQGTDLSSCDLSGVNLSSADLRKANILNANLKGANLSNAQLQGADLSSCDLSSVNLSSADLSNTKLHNARLPAWSSGLMEGVKLGGAEGWVPADEDWSNAKLLGADLSGSDLSGFDLTGAHMQGINLSKAKLHNARLPAWSSGLLEGVNLAGAEGWMPADKDLSNAKLKGADLSSCDLSGVNLSCADLRGTKLHDARLPAWSSGLMEGVNLAGAEGWVPADKDQSNAKLTGADLSGSDLSGFDLTGAHMQNVNLSNAKLHDARLPAWSSGLLEGVKLAGAEGWMPADKDQSNAKLTGANLSGSDLSGFDLSSADLCNAKLQGVVLKGADLSKCDLSGADLTGADLREAKLEGTNLRGATLCAAILHAAQGARPATTLPVTNASHLKVGQPVVFALSAARALTLQRVTLCNSNAFMYACDAKEMEVQTGPSATGPWTSVVKFTSRQTKQEQTFAAAPDATLLAGFVKVLVHDTYGGQAEVKSMALEGEGWG